MKLLLVGLAALVTGVFVGWFTKPKTQHAVSTSKFVLLPDQASSVDAFELEEKDGLLYRKDGTKFSGMIVTNTDNSKVFSPVVDGKVDAWEIEIDETSKVRHISSWSKGVPNGIELSFDQAECLESVHVESVSLPNVSGLSEPAYFNGKQTGIYATRPDGSQLFVPYVRRSVIEPYVPTWQREE
jgi:hypothetical protein